MIFFFKCFVLIFSFSFVYSKYCLPCIYELFHSQDAMIRLVLMKYLPLYVDCIKKETLQHDILPQVSVLVYFNFRMINFHVDVSNS